MKKLLALTLAMMLLSTMILPVAASETTLTLDYTSTLSPSYTLTIPADSTITNADGFNNIGMIGIENGKDLYGYHIDVSCAISPFVGTTTNTSVMAFLSYLQEGATEDAISGNTNSTDGNPTVLSFYDVQEDGSIENVAKDVNMVAVDSLYVGVFMDGNKAPTDTYTSTVTFTASLAANS